MRLRQAKKILKNVFWGDFGVRGLRRRIEIAYRRVSRCRNARQTYSPGESVAWLCFGRNGTVWQEEPDGSTRKIAEGASLYAEILGQPIVDMLLQSGDKKCTSQSNPKN